MSRSKKAGTAPKLHAWAIYRIKSAPAALLGYIVWLLFRAGVALTERVSDRVDHALHILKCFGVHTFGMRFDLDLIWLDKGGSVVRVDREVGRRRQRWCLRARSVVEAPAGRADKFLAAGVASGYTRPR